MLMHASFFDGFQKDKSVDAQNIYLQTELLLKLKVGSHERAQRGKEHISSSRAATGVAQSTLDLDTQKELSSMFNALYVCTGLYGDMSIVYVSVCSPHACVSVSVCLHQRASEASESMMLLIGRNDCSVDM